jgi:hypothetical protein
VELTVAPVEQPQLEHLEPLQASTKEQIRGNRPSPPAKLDMTPIRANRLSFGLCVFTFVSIIYLFSVSPEERMRVAVGISKVKGKILVN